MAAAAGLAAQIGFGLTALQHLTRLEVKVLGPPLHYAENEYAAHPQLKLAANWAALHNLQVFVIRAESFFVCKILCSFCQSQLCRLLTR